MANYYATTRSNYFRVKDAFAFEAWCRTRSIEFWTKPFEGKGDCYAIAANPGERSGWPTYDNDRDADIDVTDELPAHLDPRDVAILIEIGSEKLRYLIGFATAVHSYGRTIRVDLDEIYARAAEAFGSGLTITDATY
jgi:hypothetical protein